MTPRLRIQPLAILVSLRTAIRSVELHVHIPSSPLGVYKPLHVPISVVFLHYQTHIETAALHTQTHTHTHIHTHTHSAQQDTLCHEVQTSWTLFCRETLGKLFHQVKVVIKTALKGELILVGLWVEIVT